MSINTFSQYGEDIILSGILIRDEINLKDGGFYLDVGAHHPVRFSNTKLFYDYGWNGINIDPNERTSEIFQKARPRDINLEMAIGEKIGEQEFFKYDESALNSFKNRDKELIDTPYLKSNTFIFHHKIIIKFNVISQFIDKHVSNCRIFVKISVYKYL